MTLPQLGAALQEVLKEFGWLDDDCEISCEVQGMAEEIGRLRKELAFEETRFYSVTDSLKAKLLASQYQCARMLAELKAAREGLLKIYEPEKYHHWESDPYMRAGCFQFVSGEALTRLNTFLSEIDSVRGELEKIGVKV